MFWTIVFCRTPVSSCFFNDLGWFQNCFLFWCSPSNLCGFNLLNIYLIFFNQSLAMMVWYLFEFLKYIYIYIYIYIIYIYTYIHIYICIYIYIYIIYIIIYNISSYIFDIFHGIFFSLMIIICLFHEVIYVLVLSRQFDLKRWEK